VKRTLTSSGEKLFGLVLLCGVFVSDLSGAETLAWQPSPGHTQVPIWPAGAIPDPQPSTGPETMTPGENLVAGRPWSSLTNVSSPTMTVYSPSGKNTGVAVVVFPGGGYKVLAIDLEGTEVADWLMSKGITCLLLKYRVPFSGPYVDENNRYVYPKTPMALQDAQRTLSLVRFHATEWHIDPHKVGVLGFSAGGHVVAGASTHFEERTYAAVDEADKESCRPDFALAIFPGHLWSNDDRDPSTVDKETYQLRPDIHVNHDTPPTFLLQAEDDHVDDVEQSLVYYIALKNARVPVEMHLYAQGGHAFGLQPTKFPITRWPTLAETWLKTIGMVTDE